MTKKLHKFKTIFAAMKYSAAKKLRIKSVCKLTSNL